MTIKEILVHIDGASSDSVRLRLALDLAQRLGAALVGALILPSMELLELTHNEAALALALELAALERGAAAAEERFRRQLKEHGIAGDWYVVRGRAETCLAGRAWAADLVVLGQHDPDCPTILEAPEDVILACGCPALVVPYAGRFDRIGDDVVVAWNGSREASLAVHDTLPVLSTAGRTTVISVDPGDGPDIPPGEELVAALVRHGLQATSERMVEAELTISEAILAGIVDLGADLLVMGAYGHSRWRETILGGMTRDILEQMTVPVLMAH